MYLKIKDGRKSSYFLITATGLEHRTTQFVNEHSTIQQVNIQYIIGCNNYSPGSKTALKQQIIYYI